MATSGSCRTPYYQSQAQKFKWSADINKTKRTATISWKLTTVHSSNDTTRANYFLVHGTQTLKINGSTKVSFGRTRSGGAINGFCDPGCWLDKHYNGKNYADSNGDHAGIHRTVHILGTNHHKGSFTVKYDDKGKASFSVSGNFAWYIDTRRKFSETFTLDSIGPANATCSFDGNAPKSPSGKSYTVNGVPKNITVKMGSGITIPSTTPTCVSSDFVNWKGSNGKTYKPNNTLTLNTNLKLSANWSIKKYTWKYILKDIRTTELVTPSIFSATHSYDYETILPSYVFKDPTDEPFFNVGWVYKDTIYPVGYKGKWNEDIDFISSVVGKPYVINVLDRDKEYTVGVNFDDYGDKFNISIARPGCKFIGYTTTPHDPILPTADLPDDTVWAFDRKGRENQLAMNQYIKDNVDDLKLYILWQYETTTYVYTNGQWRLSIPYVYTNGKYRQSMVYKHANNKWRL